MLTIDDKWGREGDQKSLNPALRYTWMFRYANGKIKVAALILIFLKFLCSNLHLHTLIIYSILNLRWSRQPSFGQLAHTLIFFNLTVHHLQGIQACLNVLCGLIQRA